MESRKKMKMLRIMTGMFACVVLLTANPANASEPFDQDIFVGGREGYPTFRIPALVVTNKGTLLAFCEGRKTGIADHGNIDLVLKRSTDRGATWGKLQVIQGKGLRTWGNPSPVVDRQTGVVWLLSTFRNKQVFVTSSQDDGVTWAEPRDITKDVMLPGWSWYATGPGHAIQLSSGRLLVSCDHFENKSMASHVIYSDDHGLTWKLGGRLEKGTDESMAVETADGNVYISMRNTSPSKRRAFAQSMNGGESWSPVKWDEALVDSTCQASIARFSTGKTGGKNRILFLNPVSKKRENMAIRISYDEARTWTEPRTIYAGPAAYSDLAILADQTAGALYENGKRWPYDKITFVRMDLEWISNGTDGVRRP